MDSAVLNKACEPSRISRIPMQSALSVIILVIHSGALEPDPFRYEHSSVQMYPFSASTKGLLDLIKYKIEALLIGGLVTRVTLSSLKQYHVFGGDVLQMYLHQVCPWISAHCLVLQKAQRESRSLACSKKGSLEDTDGNVETPVGGGPALWIS